MTTGTNKEASIANANRLYVEGRFDEALKVYQDVTVLKPALGRVVLGNIRRCEQRLKADPIQGETTPPEIESERGDVKEWLHRDLMYARRPDSIPANPVVMDMLDSTTTEHVTRTHFDAAVQCALSSPFQRDLLWYVAALARRLECSQILHETRQGLVTLSALVKAASDHAYWLANRARLREQLGEDLSLDLRAWDLLDVPPDDRTDDHRRLPLYRGSKIRYGWHAPGRLTRGRSAPVPLAFGTILLNEKRFIGINLLQHYRLCESWSLIEGACQGYPPRKVSPEGLSLDNCSVQIRLFPDPQHKLSYVQHGWTVATGEDAKSELRNRYLEACRSDFLLVIDADEFYVPDELDRAMREFDDPDIHAVTLPQVHFWKSTDRFITGGYYDISHTRLYRHHRGMKYVRNHNFPELNGEFIHQRGLKKVVRTISEVEARRGTFTYVEPRCYHMGFTKDYDDMRDKSDYYINRGEDKTRPVTTRSRAAWFDDGLLPDECKLRPWGGDIPEVLQAIGRVDA